MSEHFPINESETKTSSRSIVAERMAEAGPQDIRGALDAKGGYWDDLYARAEQFDANRHLMPPDEADQQSRKLELEDKQARGMNYALDAWETYLRRGDTTDNFEDFVSKMAEDLADNAQKGIERAKESAVLFGHAESWNRKHLRKVMGEHFKRQESEEPENNIPEHTKPTEAEWQVYAARDEQEARHRQAEQAAEESRREAATEAARTSMESLLEQAELTQTIVNLGKNNTYVYGYSEKGFDTFIGDMEKDEAKKLMERVKSSQVNFAFGANDHNGAVRKPEGVDWHEAGVGERVSFVPVVEQEYRIESSERVVQKKRFGKDVTQKTEWRVAVPGSERRKMVMNPKTGEQEPAVLFQYDFDPVALGVDATLDIRYEGLSSTRTGAVLSVAVELPKSVADELLDSIEKQPQYVRKIAEDLVLSNSDGRISQEDWEKGRPPYNTRMKPPYERVQELAPDWKIAIAKPKNDADFASFAAGQKGKNFEVAYHKLAA